MSASQVGAVEGPFRLNRPFRQAVMRLTLADAYLTDADQLIGMTCSYALSNVPLEMLRRDACSERESGLEPFRPPLG